MSRVDQTENELRQGLAAKARAREEKDDWIRRFGSDYLKKAWDHGYPVQRPYVVERAGREFPGYVVDFNCFAKWHSRDVPTEAALDESLRVGGRVVWLIRPVEDAPDDWDKREAVLVEGFLGKYTLLREYP
jgi:hypothetical protein